MNEVVLDDIDNWSFPETYFEKLEEQDLNTPEYCIVQGQLYEFMLRDQRYSMIDALEVSRNLNNGNLERAETNVYQELEENI